MKQNIFIQFEYSHTSFADPILHKSGCIDLHLKAEAIEEFNLIRMFLQFFVQI